MYFSPFCSTFVFWEHMKKILASLIKKKLAFFKNRKDKAVLSYNAGDFNLWGTARGGEKKGRAAATEQHCARLAACRSQGLSGDKHIH